MKNSIKIDNVNKNKSKQKSKYDSLKNTFQNKEMLLRQEDEKSKKLEIIGTLLNTCISLEEKLKIINGISASSAVLGILKRISTKKVKESILLKNNEKKRRIIIDRLKKERKKLKNGILGIKIEDLTESFVQLINMILLKDKVGKIEFTNKKMIINLEDKIISGIKNILENQKELKYLDDKIVLLQKNKNLINRNNIAIKKLNNKIKENKLPSLDLLKNKNVIQNIIQRRKDNTTKISFVDSLKKQQEESLKSKRICQVH